MKKFCGNMNKNTNFNSLSIFPSHQGEEKEGRWRRE